MFVYLDQSDWSYLHDGQFALAERRLRFAGHRGQVVYILTLHHLEEIAGLEEPSERLAYLRSFPGAGLVMNILGSDLAKRDAAVMVGTPYDELSLSPVPMAEISSSKLMEYTHQLAEGRQMRRLIEPAFENSRQLHLLDSAASRKPGARKPTRDENTALWLAHIRGDVEGSVAILERILGHAIKPANRVLLGQKIARCEAGWRQAASLGILPPATAELDEPFAWGVFRHLPAAVRNDCEAVSRAAGSWKKISGRPLPLNCCALVDASAAKNKMTRYSASIQVDALHAAFAPLVHVFTADKRVEGILNGIGVENCIRTGRLDEVADRVESQ